MKVPCKVCREFDGVRCRIWICAAVRCQMIAAGFPVPPEPVQEVGPPRMPGSGRAVAGA